MASEPEKAVTLSDGVKLQYIHDIKPVHRLWNSMTHEERHIFLNAITTTDERPLVKLARSVKRNGRVHTHIHGGGRG